MRKSMELSSENMRVVVLNGSHSLERRDEADAWRVVKVTQCEGLARGVYDLSSARAHPVTKPVEGVVVHATENVLFLKSSSTNELLQMPNRLIANPVVPGERFTYAPGSGILTFQIGGADVSGGHPMSPSPQRQPQYQQYGGPSL